VQYIKKVRIICHHQLEKGSLQAVTQSGGQYVLQIMNMITAPQKVGTISSIQFNICTKSKHIGVREGILPAFVESIQDGGVDEPKYSVGMKSSVVFSPLKFKKDAPKQDALEFEAQSYNRRLGEEPLVRGSAGPVILVTDRAPDAVVERRRRRHMHELLMNERTKPFNRKKLAGSLSEYAQERCTINKLIGAVHQPGDLADIAPPHVKLAMNPADNGRITYAKSDPHFGRLGEDYNVSPYDTNLSLVRPRTTGYSPGHIRTISNSVPTSPVPILSATARRVNYCNEMYKTEQARHDRFKAAENDAAERKKYELLSIEVESGIGGFEKNKEELKAKGWKGV